MLVRYYGHFGFGTGYGRAATDYALALQRHSHLELDLRQIGIGNMPITEGRLLPLAPLFDRGGEPDVILVHTLPRDCAKVLELEKVDPRIPAVAYTTWEALTLRESIAKTLSQTFRKVLSPGWLNGFREPWSYLPHCFDEEAVLPEREVGTDGPFVFYSIGNWTLRKNMAGLIRAFAYAFAPFGGNNAALHIHSPGADAVSFQMALIATGQQALPVSFSNDYRDDAVIWKMHRDGDCFVSASRGEAWNLGAFEAAVAGRHLIVPYAQGSDMFIDAAGASAARYRSFLSPGYLEVAASENGGQITLGVKGPGGLTSQNLWLEPDLVDLADKMQQAYRFRTRDLVTTIPMAERFGYAVVAEQLTQALEDAANG